MHNEVVSFLNNSLPAAGAEFREAEVGDHAIFVNASTIEDVCRALKNSEFEMNVLQVVTGCDYEDRIELSYVIASFTKNTELILKVKLAKPSSDHVPEVNSLCSLWKSANFLERECFDMVGVNFIGHPDLRRILCPEDWEGYPLRKDYQVQEKYHDMVVNPEHKINNPDHFYFKKLQDEMEDPKKVTYSWKE